MRKLALSDEILLRIEKPARYIGNEVNSVNKDADKVDVRFCMCFPDVYEIGMSHLGLQILYDMFNRREDVWCERVFSPWTDMDKEMRSEGIPLFALESQDPVRDFDFLGITLQFEMCYTNILQILDLSGIPLSAHERTEKDPFVIGGGPCAYNPEPLADFFDLFYIGEGETVYDQLFDAYKSWKASGGSRESFLEMAAEIEGIYVPSFYDVNYKEDGTIASFLPNNPHAKEKIRRQVASDMGETTYPLKPTVPFIKATQDRAVLEIQRGCIRGCRFCQAGMVYRPARPRDIEMLKETARAMLKNTGHEEITLSSLSSSDYNELKEIVSFLIEEFKGQGVNISLPSLRIDAFSLDVMSKVQDVRKSSLTFAPEAGSQRMRDVINKGLTESEIIDGAGQAFEGGWTKVKLYFMLGLPTETREDMEGIAVLSDKVARRYYEIPKEQRNGKCQITASSSFFVPKPFSPLQWATMFSAEEYVAKANIVQEAMRNQLNRKSLRYNWHTAELTVLEGTFARGDRRMGAVLLEAYRLGCIFDSWDEYFRYDLWMQAFENTGTDAAFYNLRPRTRDEIFPWDFIDCGVTRDFLWREWENAMQGKVTPNCREKCSGCGAMTYKGGVCYEG
ncbi:TIGR03960 family B12-binding radical SAM protein [Bariatricus massiliensis]|uniref:TIGR03960 family B12-binding radical SAM protein n=1 Tax=Bariatricus massiliensis TaxID=1745713 RepID=A0ABS8DCJ9_9FIRM|nr:TIGR03960 family B12-binding radical SAM protein [Bariatricus massiliensis]MCB7303329.1 TIGR03960 family B12-binding radical SAM protein [Bariatricus massiliensis]MCB7373461.1 TIGR03960 family B12-binding radical SAM protein [Bariatricus massiliensis]MCB7386131.1 TIGR03960 family B12-binding radical SAM protein [Bariatricus massiliensis]MCB7410293.1 TIGR03960 family B12-binding radical SAM protein [Bariatricus massiliensis]MCQ5252423.1 TIGR03960 family B12-binding radical SAM protein [Baria